MSSKQPKSFFVDKQFKNRDHEDMDTNQLLRIFPEEIWRVIFENVTDLKSLENLSLASLFFRERLSSRRTTFLFPGVFECLIKKHEQDSQAFAPYTTNLEADTDEYIQDKFWKFPWTLRLVSLEWNKSIKDYFQKPLINPFVESTKHVNIFSLVSASTINSTQMLAKFGRTLKSVYLDLHFDGSENLAKYYLFLRKLLSFVPNLRKLEIRWSPSTNHDIQDFELAEMINMNPCSELKDLEFLCIVDRLPCQILGELVRQNNGFKRLKLFVSNVQRLTFDFSMHLPNLINLEVTIERDEDFERLKRFAKNWRLTSFCGMFRNFKEKTTWLEIYKMMGDNWGDTLEALCLYLPKNDECRLHPDVSICELVLKITTDERLKQMKVLKTVEIVTDCAVSLDFLLPCQKTLEEMEIVQFGNASRRNLLNPWYNDAKNRQIVEFLGKEKEMEGSNVWDLFPKLKMYKSFGMNVKRPAEHYFS